MVETSSVGLIMGFGGLCCVAIAVPLVMIVGTVALGYMERIQPSFDSVMQRLYDFGRGQ